MKHLELLNQFDQLTSELKKNNSQFTQREKDAFNLRVHPGKVDLLITCSMHGNEIAGLSVVNQLLNSILQKTIKPSMNLLFVLANREAVQLNQRQVQFDLNRSFLKLDLKTSEDLRARQLEIMALDSCSVLDIHQTTTSSLSPFFVLRNRVENLHFLNSMHLDIWPVILYKEGSFSKDGSAFSSFCFEKKIPFLTIELGLAGIQTELEQSLLQSIINIITKYSPESWQNIINNKNPATHKNTFFQEYKNILKQDPDDHLVEGLQNLSEIKKGSPLYSHKKQIISADQDYYALFPKYGIYRTTASELVRLLIKLP